MNVGQDLPEWARYAQILGFPFITVVLAALGVWMARQQSRNARLKVQHDLFDRRFAVYCGVRDLIAHVLRHGDSNWEAEQDYWRAVSPAVFLFDAEIIRFIEKEMWENVTSLHSLRSEITMYLPPAEQAAHGAKIAKRKAWFAHQASILPDRFKKDIHLDASRRVCPPLDSRPETPWYIRIPL